MRSSSQQPSSSAGGPAVAPPPAPGKPLAAPRTCRGHNALKARSQSPLSKTRAPTSVGFLSSITHALSSLGSPDAPTTAKHCRGAWALAPELNRGTAVGRLSAGQTPDVPGRLAVPVRHRADRERAAGVCPLAGARPGALVTWRCARRGPTHRRPMTAVINYYGSEYLGDPLLPGVRRPRPTTFGPALRATPDAHHRPTVAAWQRDSVTAWHVCSTWSRGCQLSPFARAHGRRVGRLEAGGRRQEAGGWRLETLKHVDSRWPTEAKHVSAVGRRGHVSGVGAPDGGTQKLQLL